MTGTQKPEQQQQWAPVRFVGGPADWRGRTVEMPMRGDDPGAYLISDDTPPRGEDEDIDPRAVYEPDPDGDPHVWHFRGWVPSSPSDPDPAWYLAQDEGGSAPEAGAGR